VSIEAAGSRAAAGGRSVGGQRAGIHHGARDTARRGRCAPVAPDDLHESGHRQGVDAAGTATHICLSTVLSDNGMAIEEISRLMGHSSSNVTETVYRHQIRPVITNGAEAMDKIFAYEG